MNEDEKNNIENSSDKIEFKRLVFPIIVMTVGYLIAQIIGRMYAGIGAFIVAALILNVFAFITCWAFVLRKNKSDAHIWINYIVWLVLISIGTIGNKFM